MEHYFKDPYSDYTVTFPDGRVFHFGYEEMVELLAAGRKATGGNELQPSMRKKAEVAFNLLPTSDY